VNISPRLVVVALVLLVLPALVTALFLARQVRWAVAPGAQPGGTIAGRIAPVGAVPNGLALEGLAVVIVGVPHDGPDRTSELRGRTTADGPSRTVAEGTTDAGGRFTIAVPPIEGHYELRISGGGWQTSIVPVTLIDKADQETVVAVRPAARLELKFTRRSGEPVRGGEWTLEGTLNRSWFSAWTGAQFARDGRFSGPDFVVEGLPPIPMRAWIRLDGGDRTELVIDLVVGANRHAVEL
jgi:hypothetical protein